MAKAKSRIILLDGGMGDEIHRRLGTHEKEWSAPGLLNRENHALVRQLHLEFAKAGSIWLTTCNFSVRTFNGFSYEQVKFACEAAGMLASEAAREFCELTGNHIGILGSLPPLLDCFRSDSVLGPKDEYILMVDALNPFVNAFLGETLSSSAEAQQVLDVVSPTGKPCWFAFTLNAEGRLYSGESASSAVLNLLSGSPKPSAVLFNCSSPEAIDLALRDVASNPDARSLLSEIDTKLGVYPNRYLPVSENWTSLEQPLRPELTPEMLCDFASRVVDDFGVSIVGGCCGISVEHIKALKSLK